MDLSDIDLGYCLLIGIAHTMDLEGGVLIGIVRTIDLGYCLSIGIARTIYVEGGLLIGVVGTTYRGDGINWNCPDNSFWRLSINWNSPKHCLRRQPVNWNI